MRKGVIGHIDQHINSSFSNNIWKFKYRITGAFAFCSIMALMLIRIMEYKATINNLKMSPQVLKHELKDLKQVILIYDEKTARIKLTHRSTVQKKLWDVFRLGNLKYGA